MAVKVAIMQPYFFPYLPYFQLVNAVDKFVVFDDVNFIKRGWIHRNNILLENQPHQISMSIQKASQNKLIKDHLLNRDPKWRGKLRLVLQHAYSKATHFGEAYPILEKLIEYEQPSLSIYLEHQIRKLSNYLGVQTEWVLSSSLPIDNHLKGEERIIAICNELEASEYINPIGGVELYSAKNFKAAGIELRFLKTKFRNYDQRPYFASDQCIQGLSIIDLLMHCNADQISDHLGSCTFDQPVAFC